MMTLICARLVDRNDASIPFGASHRVNFDTPPLKGYCQGTNGSRGEPIEFTLLPKIAFLDRNRSLTDQGKYKSLREVLMQNDNGAIETPLQRLKGRAARRYSVGTKLTKDEMKTVIGAAQVRGKSPSEWTRETLLDAARNGRADDLSGNLFTELVGIQMLIMETFESLLCGQKLTQEEVVIKFQRVQKSKAARAQELLMKRAQVS